MDSLIRFRPNDNIVYREEEDGAFLFDPDTGNLKYMNRSAKEIYLMLNGSNDIDIVIRNIDDLYPDAGMKQIREDVEILMRQLEENGFISSREAVRE
ncbi:MAG: PqqD family protein [Desulfobacterales bacterium]|nr:PqqD family protein [Desulfobacterales bacterium]